MFQKKKPGKADAKSAKDAKGKAAKGKAKMKSGNPFANAAASAKK